jgi:hypothetical protein
LIDFLRALLDFRARQGLRVYRRRRRKRDQS